MEMNLKNLIERFIQTIKDRIECFDDYFPCLKEECDYNYIRIHRKIRKPLLGIKIRKNIMNKMKKIKTYKYSIT
jgi:hypothetical protein